MVATAGCIVRSHLGDCEKEGRMGFVENFRIIKHSPVSIQTCDYCCHIIRDANARVGINKALNLQFCITLPTSLSLQGQDDDVTDCFC